VAKRRRPVVTRQGCEKDEISRIVRSEVTEAKISAKSDIIASAAKTTGGARHVECWLRYRCSEPSFSSRPTTMAEAARHGRREQPGYFVCSTEFFPNGEESPPSHQGQLRCGRRGLPSYDGSFTRTPLGERKQSHKIGRASCRERVW